MTPILRTLVAAALVAAVAPPASAASLNATTAYYLSVPLGCAIVEEKYIAISNTTGGDLSGGTLSYDYIRRGDNTHHTASYAKMTIAAGATVKKGIEPALSCTASYRKPPPALQMAPN